MSSSTDQSSQAGDCCSQKGLEIRPSLKKKTPMETSLHCENKSEKTQEVFLSAIIGD